MVRWVIWTRSPTRAAGPSSFLASSHSALSYLPFVSTRRGFFDRGITTFAVANSAVSPRKNSILSSSVSLSLAETQKENERRRTTDHLTIKPPDEPAAEKFPASAPELCGGTPSTR